ncbi:MAG: hypothetical protein U1E76_07420 [Planctomycetota bacterium]
MDLRAAHDGVDLTLVLAPGGKVLIECDATHDPMFFTIGLPGVALWRGELLNGRSELQIVPPGEYVIEVWSQYSALPVRSITISAGELRHEVFD